MEIDSIFVNFLKQLLKILGNIIFNQYCLSLSI